MCEDMLGFLFAFKVNVRIGFLRDNEVNVLSRAKTFAERKLEMKY